MSLSLLVLCAVQLFLVWAPCGNKWKRNTGIQLKFSLLCGKRQNLGWTMSHWYVIPVCLLARSESLERGLGISYSCPMGAAGPLSCLSNCPRRTLHWNFEALEWTWGKAEKGFPPSEGSRRRLTVPGAERPPVHWPHAWGGGLKARQQGLTLQSFDQRQHSLIPDNICNSQH